MRLAIALALAAAVLTSCETPTAEDLARDCEAQGLARGTPEFTTCVQQAEAVRARQSARPPSPPTPYGY